MNVTARNYLMSLNRRNFTNNVQRVLHTLLTAEGDGWVSRGTFRAPSAASRIRDLRKAEYGGFEVQCRSAASLSRSTGDRHSFFYRANRNITVNQLRRVFEGV